MKRCQSCDSHEVNKTKSETIYPVFHRDKVQSMMRFEFAPVLLTFLIFLLRVFHCSVYLICDKRSGANKKG